MESNYRRSNCLIRVFREPVTYVIIIGFLIYTLQQHKQKLSVEVIHSYTLQGDQQIRLPGTELKILVRDTTDKDTGEAVPMVISTWNMSNGSTNKQQIAQELGRIGDGYVLPPEDQQALIRMIEYFDGDAHAPDIPQLKLTDNIYDTITTKPIGRDAEHTGPGGGPSTAIRATIVRDLPVGESDSDVLPAAERGDPEPPPATGDYEPSFIFEGLGPDRTDRDAKSMPAATSGRRGGPSTGPVPPDSDSSHTGEK